MAPNVLVVEDDDSIRLLLIEYLREHSGLPVDGARDGVDALHQIHATRYDVVVLDLMMPFMTGIDFLDSLVAMTSDPSLENIELPSVVVITAAPSEQVATEEITRRFPALVRAVFRKPLVHDELARMVEKLLGIGVAKNEER